MRQEVKLGTLGDIFIGLTYKPENVVDAGGTVVLRSSNIQEGKIDLEDIVRVDCPVREKLWVKDNDILMCSRNGSAKLVGKTALINNLPEDMTFGAFMTIIRTPYNNYLQYYFKSPFFRRQLNSSATTTINQITKSMLDGMFVPVFDTKTAEKITETLSKCEQIICDRKRELEKLDELIKARFVEMFGTLHDNEKDFEVVTIEDVCSLIKDGTHQTPQYTEDKETGYKFLSSKDVMSQKINWTNIKYIPAELHEKLYATIKPQKNDILMSKNGVNYGVAAVNDTDEVFDIYVSLALLRPKEAIDPVFFRCVINNPETKRQFDSSIKGIGVPNLHLGEIKKTKIFLPPMELQKEFVSFVNQVDKSKVIETNALRCLKYSLMPGLMAA